MSFWLKNIRINIQFAFIGVITLLLFLDSDMVVISGLAAAVLHEIGHLTAIFFCGCKPKEIVFEPFGIKIVQANQTSLSYRKEVFILLCGPLANFGMFWALFDPQKFLQQGMLSLSAAANLVLFFLNILPVGNLDGGKISAIFFQLICKDPVKAGHLSNGVSILFLFPLFVLGFYLFFHCKNFSLLLICGYLMVMLIFSQND